MTLLAGHARIDTEYGGGFVSGINGVKSTFGGVSSAQAADWFYWVDGTMADVGAADYRLHGGETVWWDFHQWAHAMSIPAALSAFPAQWRVRPLKVAANEAWPGLRQWAQASGLTLGQTSSLAAGAPGGGLVVATPQEATAAKWLRQLLDSGDGVRMVRLRGERSRCSRPLALRAHPPKRSRWPCPTKTTSTAPSWSCWPVRPLPRSACSRYSHPTPSRLAWLWRSSTASLSRCPGMPSERAGRGNPGPATGDCHRLATGGSRAVHPGDSRGAQVKLQTPARATPPRTRTPAARRHRRLHRSAHPGRPRARQSAAGDCAARALPRRAGCRRSRPGRLALSQDGPLHRHLPGHRQPTDQPQRRHRALAVPARPLPRADHHPGDRLRCDDGPAHHRRDHGLRPLHSGARPRRPARPHEPAVVSHRSCDLAGLPAPAGVLTRRGAHLQRAARSRRGARRGPQARPHRRARAVAGRAARPEPRAGRRCRRLHGGPRLRRPRSFPLVARAPLEARRPGHHGGGPLGAAVLLGGLFAGAFSYNFYPLLDDPWSQLGSLWWLLAFAALVVPALWTLPWRRSRS